MQRINSLIILFSFVTFSNSLFCQIRTNVPVKELDSLIQILPTFQDEKLVDHLNLIATSISQRYPDSCLYYAGEAFDLANSLEYEFGEAEAVFNIGNGYFYKIDVKNALSKYLEILPYYRKLKTSMEYGNLLMQIGYINRFISNDLEAIKYFKQALSVYKEISVKIGQINSSTEMAYCYMQANLYDSAIIYYKNNIIECKLHGYHNELAKNYNDLGIVFLWRSEEIQKDKRYEGPNAAPYFDSALLINVQNNYLLGQAVNLENLGHSYFDHIFPPQYDIAIKYYHRSILAAKNSGYNFETASTYASLGSLHAEINNFDLAKSHLDTSLHLVNVLKSAIDTVVYSRPGRKLRTLFFTNWIKSFAYEGYYKLYKALGNIDSSIYYYRMKVAVEDSVNQQSTQNQINYMIAKVENEMIDQELVLLEKEKNLQENRAQRSVQFLIGLIILVILIILITLLYFRQNKMKEEQEKSNLQQKLFRTQMNPHFIFNSLSSIQHLVVNEDSEKASIYLAKFSTLVRSVLYSSNKDSITIDDELKTIESYLSLQNIRYSNKFDYKVDIDPQIDTESLTIPPMLAQPFIENAIEHGVKHKKKKGNIDIRFVLDNGSIHLEIEDDGVGRAKVQELEKELKKDHHSMATEITKERLKVLNKKLKDKIDLTISDLEDEKGNPAGTKVRIILPVASV